MPLTDRPAPPEIKLRVRQSLAENTGKEFNEALEREVMGLPPAKHPIFIAENPDRARQTRREDVAGKRELEELAAAAQKSDLALQVQERDQRIDELERQMRELTGGGSGLRARGEIRAGPAAKGAPAPLPDEEPTENWTMKQIVQWGGERGVRVPNPKAMSKRAALNHIKEALAEAEPAEYEDLDDAGPEEEEPEDAV